MKQINDIKKFVTNKMVYCGIDVHKRHWHLCYYCDGIIVDKIVITSDFEKLLSHTRRFYSTARQVQFVYEAGFSGNYLCRQLITHGYECQITPPNRIPQVYNKVKTDKLDAAKLAQFLAAGLLKSIYVMPLSAESDRQVIRLRKSCQKKSTRVKNQIKSYLNLNGIKWPKEKGNKWTKKYIEWLEALEFEYANQRMVIDEYLNEYHFLREQIAKLTRQLRAMSKQSNYSTKYKRLTSCKGVGLITAMTFLLELHDITRFRSSEKFCSYLGMTPSQFSSGDNKRLGHITREGNAHIRCVLVESAWTVIRHDPVLREKYNRIRAKGTNGKKAIVAVARSLAVRLRRCLLDDIDYVIGVA